MFYEQYLILVRIDAPAEVSMNMRDDAGGEIDMFASAGEYPFRFLHESGLTDSLLSNDQRVTTPLKIFDNLVEFISSAKEGRILPEVRWLGSREDPRVQSWLPEFAKINPVFRIYSLHRGAVEPKRFLEARRSRWFGLPSSASR